MSQTKFPSLRSQLSSRCHGFQKAILTQANTAVGSKLVYDGEKKRSLQVTPEIFSTFAKVRGEGERGGEGGWLGLLLVLLGVFFRKVATDFMDLHIMWSQTYKSFFWGAGATLDGTAKSITSSRSSPSQTVKQCRLGSCTVSPGAPVPKQDIGLVRRCWQRRHPEQQQLWGNHRLGSVCHQVSEDGWTY